MHFQRNAAPGVRNATSNVLIWRMAVGGALALSLDCCERKQPDSGQEVAVSRLQCKRGCE